MPLIAGAVLGSTQAGKALKDGAACLLSEHECVALATERLERRKHIGGFEGVLAHLLGDRDKPDLLVLSSCCEYVPSEEALTRRYGHLAKRVVPSPTHHYSHALTAAMTGEGDPTLVCVLDGGGSVLDSTDTNRWWEVPREQASYYAFDGESELRLLERDFLRPREAGFGEVFRAFTHYLGWPSASQASKLMALAGVLSEDRGEPLPLFEADSEHVRGLMEIDPRDPIGSVSNWARRLGVPLPPPRLPGEELTRSHAKVAAGVQRALEVATLARVRGLLQDTQLSRVAIAGGVGLNCVNNGRLAQALGTQVWVPSAPADDGQALGNALYGALKLGCNLPLQVSRPFLGPEYTLRSVDLISTAESRVGAAQCRHDPEGLAAAQVLSAGGLVGVWSGRSEFGPRALGHRSILGRPDDPVVSKRLNLEAKDRLWFQPFGVSLFQDDCPTVLDRGCESPHMSHVATVKDPALLAGAMHGDGTVRIQTLAPSEAGGMASVLRAWRTLGGPPALINTSFNRRGEPIVETHEQAVDAALHMGLDAVLLEDVLISLRGGGGGMRRPWHRLESGQSSFEALPETDMTRTATTITFTTDQYDLDEVVSLLQERLPDLEPRYRDHFGLLDEYLDWMLSGRKTTTIRYRRGTVDLPERYDLPLHSTELKRRGRHRGCQVKIRSMTIKRFGDLDHVDAVRDGFATLEELQAALSCFYGDIGEDELVTIYRVDPE